MRSIQTGSTRAIPFLLIDSADNISGLTGATPTVTLSKAGGLFGAPGGTVSEIGDGWYALTPTAADTDTLGPLVLHATATGANPTDIEAQIVAYDPDVAYSTLTATQVNAEADQALADYDPPTRAEATADKDAIIAQGDSAWITATGFSTHSAADVAAVILVTPANLLDTDASGNVAANNMRGTDNAILATSAPANFSDLSITATTGLVDVSDKSGFKLAADGLDPVTLPDVTAAEVDAGLTTLTKKMAFLFQRFGLKVVYDKTAETITVHDAAGTAVAVQSASEVNSVQTVEKIT